MFVFWLFLQKKPDTTRYHQIPPRNPQNPRYHVVSEIFWTTVTQKHSDTMPGLFFNKKIPDTTRYHQIPPQNPSYHPKIQIPRGIWNFFKFFWTANRKTRKTEWLPKKKKNKILEMKLIPISGWRSALSGYGSAQFKSNESTIEEKTITKSQKLQVRFISGGESAKNVFEHLYGNTNNIMDSSSGCKSAVAKMAWTDQRVHDSG